MRIALIHDYLSEFGGAERVLMALHEIWPEAPIYTAFMKRDSMAGRTFIDAQIIESWLAPLIKHKNLFSPLRFLAPLIWKGFDFSDYDLVLTSASWYITRGFRVGPKTKVFCYCHTPPRYLYDYPTAMEWQRYWPIKLYGLIINHFLRAYDYRSAQQVDEFMVNSKNVADRVKKFYRREATVIYPPVEIHTSEVSPLATKGGGGTSADSAELTAEASEVKNYFLCVSRLSRPKNIDLAIKACNRLGGELWVVGGGREEDYLKSIAGPTIKFLGEVSDRELAEIYRHCQAFLALAADEDFGMTPVEAMAAGRPVIAFRGGGYLETVIEGKTGLFFDELTVESLIRAIKKLRPCLSAGRACLPTGRNLEIDERDCIRQAEKFSKERFKKEIQQFVESKIKK